MNEAEILKKQAALKAIEHVQSGMFLGLGTGSTANYVILGIGERLAKGNLHTIRAVATSKASEDLAKQQNIPLVELDDQVIDLAIDGMDEVDANLNAIKGLGGALTREKIVAARANVFILIGDESKQVTQLGEKTPLPVEVIPFAWQASQAALTSLGLKPQRRQKAEEIYITDNGNYILDCAFTPSNNVQELATAIEQVPGVLTHGFFLNMANLAYIASKDKILKLGSL